MLKEILESSIPTNTAQEIESIALLSLAMISQSHIYHLVTNRYSEHMAINEFYNSLQTNFDKLVETYLGANSGKHFLSGKIDFGISLDYNKSVFVSELDNYRENIVKSIGSTSSNSLISINDALVDILSDIDNLKYKLTLGQ